ncbi:hypothetical protein QYM36_017745 [Artemia franciscana]|uniref:PiggyBac transposable element-derived protein domain-containing protein n=1 Tax=Artemia franciscana TaxID=6661 RepID=A0AA88H814_ARTSF|nr:hypothetical protein QYM36_017745 [Artemia franciscana]
MELSASMMNPPLSAILMAEVAIEGKYLLKWTSETKLIANDDGPPKLEAKKELRRGDLEYDVRSDETYSVSWKGKRCKQLLSTFHKGGEVTQISRMEKDGCVTQVTYPNLVVKCNKFVGCVNKADMLKSLYAIERKKRKWWHHLLWHFVDITTVNAFVLLKLSTILDANRITLKDFICRIVTGMVESYSCKGERGRTTSKSEVIPKFKPQEPQEKRLNQSKHLPVHGTS